MSDLKKKRRARKRMRKYWRRPEVVLRQYEKIRIRLAKIMFAKYANPYRTTPLLQMVALQNDAVRFPSGETGTITTVHNHKPYNTTT